MAQTDLGRSQLLRTQFTASLVETMDAALQAAFSRHRLPVAAARFAPVLAGDGDFRCEAIGEIGATNDRDPVRLAAGVATTLASARAMFRIERRGTTLIATVADAVLAERAAMMALDPDAGVITAVETARPVEVETAVIDPIRPLSLDDLRQLVVGHALAGVHRARGGQARTSWRLADWNLRAGATIALLQRQRPRLSWFTREAPPWPARLPLDLEELRAVYAEALEAWHDDAGLRRAARAAYAGLEKQAGTGALWRALVTLAQNERLEDMRQAMVLPDRFRTDAGAQGAMRSLLTVMRRAGHAVAADGRLILNRQRGPHGRPIPLTLDGDLADDGLITLTALAWGMTPRSGNDRLLRVVPAQSAARAALLGIVAMKLVRDARPFDIVSVGRVGVGGLFAEIAGADRPVAELYKQAGNHAATIVAAMPEAAGLSPGRRRSLTAAVADSLVKYDLLAHRPDSACQLTAADGAGRRLHQALLRTRLQARQAAPAAWRAALAESHDVAGGRRRLVLSCLRHPDAVATAAAQARPDLLVAHLLKIADAALETVPPAGPADEDCRLLAGLAGHVLEHGLYMLGLRAAKAS